MHPWIRFLLARSRENALGIANTLRLCAALCCVTVVHAQSGLRGLNVAVSQEPDRGQITIRWDARGNSTSSVLLDDNPGFHTPIFLRTVGQNTLTLKSLDTRLIPGVTYYGRVEPQQRTDADGEASLTKLRLQAPAFPEPYLTYNYARDAWVNAGREWLHTFGGIRWNDKSKSWDMDAQ